jgi:PPOX class probable FMN-dependent enzyme
VGQGEAIMALEFSHIITSEDQLREVIGYPSHRVTQKTLSALDNHCRAFIAKSPFLLIASSDAQGNMDISPKGDPPGFVQVLDDKTIAIPDRPGNNRADTFTNILQHPKVGLFFIIPGKRETLRVSGAAMIVRDEGLRERMAIRDKAPDFAMVIHVEEAFFHCSKCMVRSKIWQPEDWPALDGLPSLAETMVDAGQLADSVEEMQALVEQDEIERLY